MRTRSGWKVGCKALNWKGLYLFQWSRLKWERLIEKGLFGFVNKLIRRELKIKRIDVVDWGDQGVLHGLDKFGEIENVLIGFVFVSRFLDLVGKGKLGDVFGTGLSEPLFDEVDKLVEPFQCNRFDCLAEILMIGLGPYFVEYFLFQDCNLRIGRLILNVFEFFEFLSSKNHVLGRKWIESRLMIIIENGN